MEQVAAVAIVFFAIIFIWHLSRGIDEENEESARRQATAREAAEAESKKVWGEIQDLLDSVEQKVNLLPNIESVEKRRLLIMEAIEEFETAQKCAKDNDHYLPGMDDIRRSMEVDKLNCIEKYSSTIEGSTLIAVVDTETTGLGELDEPIAIGIVLLEISGDKFEVANEIKRYYGRRYPSVPVGFGAYKVHGIDRDSLVGEKFDDEQVRRLLISANFVVAHNAKFDRKMLDRVLLGASDFRWVCSIESLRSEWHSITKGSKSLDSICRALSIPRPEVHHAIDDCDALIAALKTRSGKTNRSMTLMGRLIKNPRT